MNFISSSRTSKIKASSTLNIVTRTKELIKQGKVRAIGICEGNADTIRRANATHPLAAVQSEYSLLYREQAEEALEATRNLGISFIAYSPLGRGLLTSNFLGMKCSRRFPISNGGIDCRWLNYMIR